MKKSLKKILFTVLTVFAIFFVVACGNKEDAKINKEEVIKNFSEANNNIKSADLVTTVNMTPKKGGESINVTVTASLIVDPLTLKMTMETKGQNVKINSFIKDDIMYIQNPVDNSWVKQSLPEEVSKQFKHITNNNIDNYELFKDNLDKIDIKEKDGNYLISIVKDTDFLKEAMKKQNSNMGILGQGENFEVNNITMEYVVDKETYLTKSSIVSFETELQGQDIKLSTSSEFSNINNIKEITIPEEVFNAVAIPGN
ncbi:DUF6612 family protein [Fusobacterium periodonticum]|uniref:Lipoprotein n=1 Tax=Fusobacterium periodonticum ATCC 33693 TaxID=546275 RepID=D4CX23_9FUSO|nr:DUF6612 family protein [Fusobacterium periodonticum]EFE85943.1 hypothetical protein FUSPEROL_01983 [Fusobacterium periodonticum ATCC 33693]